MMSSKIKAIIFDLDGVLVDATEWHYEALNKALQIFGYSIDRYEHITKYNGLPTRKKLDMLSIEKGLPKSLHGFINKLKQKYTVDEIYKNCKPNFEKLYMLSRLKNDGYKMVVASNAIHDTVELMLKKSKMIDYFEFFLSNQDVKNPKPDPEIYNLSIAKLRLKPEDCIIIEDAPHGIIAAKAACPNVLEVKDYGEVNYFRIVDYLKKQNFL